MNILILSPFFPYPLSQGGKIRVFNIIKYLSRSHKITLACLSDTRISDYGPLTDHCEEVLCIERRQRPVRDLAGFLSGSEPYNYLRFSSAVFRNALRELLKRKTFDLVQVEFSMMWQYAGIFKGIPTVLDAHNIESDIVKQIGTAYGNPLRKFLYFVEDKKLRRGEEEAWRRCDLCVAVSEKEHEVIASHCNSGRVFTVPNGVDLERFEFVQETHTGRQLLFIGGMEYQPNLDSAAYFLERIFPLVESGMADVKLDIVGRELRRISARPDSLNVEFHENVPDILPFFRRADVLVVPLRKGAGTRIKILEAMASGLPVVSTSKGCEGIGAKDGEHLLIADTPEAFASAVRKILTDESLRKSLARNARDLVERKYSWEKIVQGLERHYATLNSK